jgi:hypothetical protein
MANFDIENYVTVQERIAHFYQDFTDGSIRTFMTNFDGVEVVFEARAFRTPEESAMGVYTSGWAHEISGKSPVNKTSFVENCESSAIGRALANLGYATDANRPSRSEMLKVARTREEHQELLELVKSIGPNVPEDAQIYIGGKEHNLKQYVRDNWTVIKEQYKVARQVIDAMEKATEASA